MDKYIICEKGLRVGTFMILHRYAKANNKYLAEHNNPDKISSYLMVYLDANNLYGILYRLMICTRSDMREDKILFDESSYAGEGFRSV